MSQTLKNKQVIIPLNWNCDYLEAYRRTNGNLPSNVLHDKCLVESGDWIELKKNGYYGFNLYSPVWAKEILVFPERNGTFKGKDNVIDGNWSFDQNSIPEEAIGKEKVALFIKRPMISENNGKVVISAEREDIVVLNNFIQKNGWGKVDEETRMPLEVADSEKLELDQKRFLWRFDEAGIRPINRSYDNSRVIGLGGHFSSSYGVAKVGTEDEAKIAIESNIRFSQKDEKIILAPEFSSLVRDASLELSILSSTRQFDLYEMKALTKLLASIKIND